MTSSAHAGRDNWEYVIFSESFKNSGLQAVRCLILTALNISGKNHLASVFGVWSSDSGNLLFRILPGVDRIRIKIFDVRRLEEMNLLFHFAGLPGKPRRTKWKNFEITTNIKRKGLMFEPGEFILPFSRRRNLINLNWIDRMTLRMDFFYLETAEAPVSFAGSFVLRRLFLDESRHAA